MVEKDEHRESDDQGEIPPVTFRPQPDKPSHWLPKQGHPLSIAEWMSQYFIRFFAWLPAYTAVVLTLVLIIEIWHPFGLGER